MQVRSTTLIDQQAAVMAAQMVSSYNAILLELKQVGAFYVITYVHNCKLYFSNEVV